MVSAQQAIARRGGEWTIGVRIESLGTEDGLYTWHAGDAPNYAAEDPLWHPLLAKLPDTLSSRVSPRGGMRDAGSFPFELFDEDDFLTSLFRWDAPALTQLWQNLNASDLTFAVLSLTALVEGTVFHLDREALVVESTNGAVSPPTVTVVSRGALGTEPTPHAYRAEIKLYIPRLERRHVELFAVPKDADDDEARLVIDQFVIRKVDYSKDWSGYVFQCANFAMGLKRTIGDIASGHYRVTHVIRGGNLSLDRVGIDRTLWNGVGGPTGRTINPWPNEYSYYLLGEKELIVGSGSELNGIDKVRIIQRGRLGTTLIDLPAEGVYSGSAGPTLRPVLVASDADGINSFRRSLIGATDRDNPNEWEKDSHFTTILLCLFTSSRHPDDGLELVNFEPGKPNYSSLAPGWGAGMHYSKINYDSFLSARARTPGLNFEGFILHGPAKLFEMVQRQFLEPLGAFITLDAQQRITFVLPRAPYEGLVLSSFDRSTLIALPRGNGTYKPAIEGGFDSGSAVRAILFKMRGPTGETVTNLIPASDLIPGAAGSQLADGETDDILTLQLDYLLADQTGGAPFLEELALRLLSRIHKPPLVIPAQADLEMYEGHPPGALAELSFEAGPNHVTGTRGWIEDVVLVGERSISLSAIASGEPFGPDYVLYKYGSSDRAGLIAPTALITNWDAMTNTATIEVNRYTDVDADAEGLPDDDHESLFDGAVASDSKWILLRQDGTRASPIGVGDTRFQQAIASPAANQVQFDGDWEGAAAAGLIIALADYDDAIAADQALFVADADRITRKVGASARAPWPYAEI
jgi:hypothetical protein